MNEIEIFKALADPTRLKILDCIKNEEKCICEVIPYTGKSQPNVSLHLKTLKNAGLITERKDGTRIMLSIADKDVFKLIDIANKFKG
ncbi:MAG TPA: winged helix-turn-helix transcriptional regulator [Thermoplasmata archaeon]|jgi:DNA-binding transcriptional ArsR family regulator|nr:metalloregulator ArsR/SmtB family transcription factor [Euryarchaeota archaeon]HIG99442.1 winged helix-turn-helix transcriptional regulator [Thermoplasmata archaeon]HIH28680.1 winged helix-turn-helix transcriptional regulator [Thermoplasmata archaeon]